MTDELLEKIERLEAQVAALTDERLPKVDRASRRRDRRQVLGGFGLFAVAVLIAGTLSASALAGTNTVDSGDIINGQVYGVDIHDRAVTGAKVLNDSLTGSDINEGTLQLPIHATSNRTINSNIAPNAFAYAYCPAGYIATGGGDPNDAATSSEDGGVNIGGTYTNTGEVPVGWAVRNTSAASSTISVQVICLKF